MCLGMPGKILKIEGTKAQVEMLGVTSEISIALVENLKINDYVIIHAGSAISIIDEEEAKKTIEIFEELSEIMKQDNK